MSIEEVNERFLLAFAPESWPSVTKFRHFMGAPFKPDRELITGTTAAEGHLGKFLVLAGLVNRLRVGLAADYAELERDGYTPATKSREYGALIETLVCELYSSLNGVKRVLFSAYKSIPGVQNKSTGKMFIRARKKLYGEGFPEDINDCLATSYDTWFPRLRKIRTEITHGEIGTCHLDPKTDKVNYIHSGLGSVSRAFVIDDVDAEINEYARGVDSVLKVVFGSLFSRLEPIERKVLCGMFKYRGYERFVTPGPELSFQSGRCASRKWFASVDGFECPLRQNCQAYLRSEA